MKAMTMIRLYIAATSVAGLSTTGYAQTIPEIARTRPQSPIVRGRLTEIQPSTLEELTVGADVVMEGTVSKIKSYLTADEENILTDYQVFPVRVLAGKAPASPQTPGTPVPLVVTFYGGELTIEGHTVTVIDHSLRRPEAGRRYLLFLKQFGAPGHYQLYQGGAFEVNNQELKGLVSRGDKELFSDIVGNHYDEVIDRVTKVGPRKR